MTDDQDKWIDARAFGRPMSARDFKAWRREVGKLYPDMTGEDGLMYERDAAELLGISRGGLRNAEIDGAQKYIALACAAILAGLKPYGEMRYTYKRKQTKRKRTKR